MVDSQQVGGVGVDETRLVTALQAGADGAFESRFDPVHEAARAVTQPWPTRDGRWFLPHFGLPNLRARVQRVLGCETNPEAVAVPRNAAQQQALTVIERCAVHSLRARERVSFSR